MVRFSEYQLEPATSHIVEGSRPPRAWSVGSRAAVGAAAGGGAHERHRAYSVGAHCRPVASAPRAPASAPLLPRASAEDLMELDFSANCSPQPKVIVARTPPTAGFAEPRPRANTDEYVDMSPRTAFLPPTSVATPTPAPALPLPQTATSTPIPDGYVEMNYTRAPSRPIAIASRSSAVPPQQTSPPRLTTSSKTPLGSQTIFPISLESPASPPELNDADVFDDDAKEEPLVHPLTTVREISEEGGRRSPECEVSSSPQYVRLLAANPTANKTLTRPPDNARASEATGTATVVVAGVGPAARFVPGPAAPSGPSPPPPALQYAALDLQPRRASQPPPPRTYTQIDFLRSEKLHADAT